MSASTRGCFGEVFVFMEEAIFAFCISHRHMIKHSGNKTQESTPKQWSLKFRILVFAWFKGWGPILILCQNLSSVSQETHLFKIRVECCHLQQKWHMDNQVQWNHQDYASKETKQFVVPAGETPSCHPGSLSSLGHLRSSVVISTTVQEGNLQNLIIITKLDEKKKPLELDLTPSLRSFSFPRNLDLSVDWSAVLFIWAADILLLRMWWYVQFKTKGRCFLQRS